MYFQSTTYHHWFYSSAFSKGWSEDWLGCRYTGIREGQEGGSPHHLLPDHRQERSNHTCYLWAHWRVLSRADVTSRRYVTHVKNSWTSVLKQTTCCSFLQITFKFCLCLSLAPYSPQKMEKKFTKVSTIWNTQLIKLLQIIPSLVYFGSWLLYSLLKKPFRTCCQWGHQCFILT